MMAQEPSSQERIELVIRADDLILPFQANQADVVGRLVKLGPVVDTVLSRHDYPEPVSKLLGDAVGEVARVATQLSWHLIIGDKQIDRAIGRGLQDELAFELEGGAKQHAERHSLAEQL